MDVEVGSSRIDEMDKAIAWAIVPFEGTPDENIVDKAMMKFYKDKARRKKPFKTPKKAAKKSTHLLG
ncbi:hypothetical protein SUGI_0380730 [Cryptomeria japonica]|nr:hypothetical protein SUGI_0380730 [Cryptomeria japonica]